MEHQSGSFPGVIGVGALVAVAFTAACDTSSSPTALEDPAVAAAVGDENPFGEGGDPSQIDADIVRLCIFFPDEAKGLGPWTFEASADGGDVLAGPFDLDFPEAECREIWNDDGAAGTQTITAELVALHDDLTLDSIATRVGPQDSRPTAVWHFNTSSASIDLPDGQGGTIWFKFSLDEAPPGGGEGCTPGYWRQAHHFDSWEGFDPSDSFDAVFGGNHFPGETLGEVVRARGGGINALARHAVAALLNASSSGVDYDLTTQEVIDAFTAAAAGTRREMNARKDAFDTLNNQGCPLN
ncbi:MAG: hypothetical protein RQ745_11990 [Longimicrobiales bacterium]|nr:hypothetical protein [Longimicrobiales bacterium]